MHRSRFLLPAILVALVLAACGDTASSSTDEPSQAASTAASPTESTTGSEPSEAAGEEETVRLSQFAFDTEELTIAAGTDVRFVNADSAAHTVTEGTDGAAAEDPIIDEELEQGGATSFTFDEPGTYQITCLFHPDMNLTITVEA